MRRTVLHPSSTWVVTLALTLILSPVALAGAVRVVALFPGKALVSIDGQRHLLKVGQDTVPSVRLISATSQKAVIEESGIRSDYFLQRDLGNGVQQPELKTVTINRNLSGQYLTSGLINRSRVEMLIDTGANVVALSSDIAKKAGIRYQAGEKVRAETASGLVDAYKVTLNSVSVGSITIYNVVATVIEGYLSDTVLLGMSYLRHVSLSKEGGIMMLQSRY